ncbi:uncharacterized protein GLRG_11960 [Colletotrichum graminicola M1.001]|uniref:GST N-terminal domain-containing protein n=1 Tax=Colletotrichum graminicola (strain M1.001 / M2 / FGSC 10212) TaxID=645133 RepID=E3R126_COLGM|nr:uncharacterized protein GLRG_11960 [Colletotrichum graminicola M1.001]EFQ36814.1 hypothetical protein GLRG_11960 [Colletotrichum graminicola M1.001]
MPPAFTLYGARGSTNTDRVRLSPRLASPTTNSCSLTCNRSVENIKRHLWGKVPVVTFPDSFNLYESRAICKYLASKYSFPPLPLGPDAKAAGLFDQAQSEEMLLLVSQGSQSR